MIDALKDISGQLSEFRALIATIGIPLLALVVTSYVQRRNAKIAASVKIAEMRQAWINSLRDLFVQFSQASLDRALMDKTANMRTFVVQQKIILHMNPLDPDYTPLLKLMEAMQKDKEGEFGPESMEAHKQFVICSQKLLKREWDRLKADLRENKI